MKTAQRITSQIGSILLMGKAAGDVDAPTLASEFAKACEEANGRLRQCKRYLSSGMLSEAMHVAAAQPELLDYCALLDFIGVEDWASMCSRQSWVVAERIDEGVVDLLNEHFSSAMALEPTIRQYRKAVQAKETGRCIELLRKIVSLDGSNTNWKQDLEAFEKKRLKEIQSNYDLAEKADDSSTLAEYLEAINDDWSVDPSAELRTDVENAYRAVRERESAAKGTTIITEISEAFSSLEYEPLKTGITEYEELLAKGYFKPTLTVTLQFDEANEWLRTEKSRIDEELSFQRDLAMLRAELEKPKPTEKVALLWQRVEAHRREVADDISHRARIAIENARLLVQRKKRQTLALAIAGSVAFSAIVLGGVWRWQLGSEIEYWSTQLEQAFQASDVSGFANLIKEIPNYRRALFGRFLEHSEEIVSWTKRFDELCQSVNQREKRFMDEREVLEAIAAQNFSTDFDRISGSLKKAEELALTDNQNAFIAAYKAQWRTHSDSMIGDYIQKLSLSMPTFDSFSTIPMTALAPQIASVKAIVSNAKSVRFAAPVSHQQLEPYENEIKDLEVELHRRSNMLVTITNSANLLRYMQACEEYASEFPNDHLTFTSQNTRDVSSRQYEEFLDLLQEQEKVISERTIRLRDKWPAARDSIIELEGNDMLVGLSFFPKRALASSRTLPSFLISNPTDTDGSIRGYYCHANVYSPEPKDSIVKFNIRRFNLSFTNSVSLMAHSVFMRNFVSDVKVSAPEDSLWLVASYLEKIARMNVWDKGDIEDLKDSLPNHFLKFQMLSFLATLASELAEPGLFPEIDGALDEMNRISEPSVDWLCLNNPEVLEFNETCRSIISAHFENPQWIRKRKFASEAEGIIVRRGIRWCGFVDPHNPKRVHWRGERPNEAWVIRQSPDGEIRPFVVLAKAKDGRYRSFKRLHPCEPILAPNEDSMTLELLRELCTDYKIGDPAKVQSILPANWPRHRR